MRFALDHLTVVDTTPAQLADVAAATGYDGICLFQQSMPVLPRMPTFDLVADGGARRDMRRRCADLGLAIDLVYPFTLTKRSTASDFRAGLDAAADLGAGAVNVLVYDGDVVHRREVFAGFCELALARGLRVAIEFYPPSQVGDLGAALQLAAAGGPAGRVGVNLDLLHLMRSGGAVGDLAGIPVGRILLAQLCDGPALPPADPVAEAGQSRLLPGAGAFDVTGFVTALPAETRLSLEVPREDAVMAGFSAAQRAAAALAAARGIFPQNAGK